MKTQNESKHTPGPWEVKKNNSRFVVSALVGKDELQTHYAHICDFPEDWGTVVERGDANARLIAAAPELLEALKNSVIRADALAGRLSSMDKMLLDVTKSPYDGPVGEIVRWDKEKEIICSAISKAEGR